VPLLALGVASGAEKSVLGLDIHAGRLPAADERACVLERGFAEENGFQLGGAARLWTPSGLHSVPVVGILEPAGAAMTNRGAVVFMPLQAAQELFDLEGSVNCVQIVVEDDVLRSRVENSIEAMLPAGFRIQRPSARGALAQSTFVSTDQLLSALSAVSLVAAAFVILNTFLMNLSERRRQLAILRSVGMTRAGLTRVLLRESLVLGIAATVVGIPLGLGIATGFLEIFGESFGARSASLDVSLGSILFAAFLGPGLPVLATYFPARQASADSILDALFDRRPPKRKTVKARSIVAGVFLVAFPTYVTLGMVFEWFARELTPVLLAPAMAFGLIGLVLLLPLVVPILSRLVSMTLGRVCGVEGRLAIRQLNGRPARTNLTVAVLFIAVVVGVATGTALVTHVDDIRDNIDRIAGDDYLVRSAVPKATLLFPASMPESLGEELRVIEGVSSIDTVTWFPARSGDQPMTILAISNETGGSMPLDFEAGDPNLVGKALRDGEVVVGTTLAQRLAIGVGDSFLIETREGQKDFRVAATVTEYTSAGLAVYMDRDVARRFFDVRGVHVFRVGGAGGDAAGAANGVHERLAAFCASRELILHTPADFKAMVDRMMDDVVGLVWGLIFLFFLVASLGVVNTITMNVLEQTRQLGLLRAIGMRRRQLFKFVLSQAGALAAMSLVPGAVFGIVMSYAMHVSGEAVNGIPVDFRIAPGLLAGCLALTLGLALLTAFGPARRASRLQVIEALRYE
ncbi:MAG: FtsX-like permease family protein, partial [Myxococcota bacterium]